MLQVAGFVELLFSTLPTAVTGNQIIFTGLLNIFQENIFLEVLFSILYMQIEAKEICKHK